MFDGVNTTRAIEKNCRENINYMWILRGAPAPDHNTVARFISNYKIEIEKLFYQLINRLNELNEIGVYPKPWINKLKTSFLFVKI